MGKKLTLNEEKLNYYDHVLVNIRELKTVYPFVKFSILPTRQPEPIHIQVIAANKSLIQVTHSDIQDFLGTFSKELEIIVPFDYEVNGCIVYGGRWINSSKLPSNYLHFHKRLEDGRYSFCVGVPDSFRKMKNVILENVRTADHMLSAYEFFQSGQTQSLELISYSHGDRGINEYRQKIKRY